MLRTAALLSAVASVAAFAPRVPRAIARTALNAAEEEDAPAFLANAEVVILHRSKSPLAAVAYELAAALQGLDSVGVGVATSNVNKVLDGRPMKATPDQRSRGGQISNADGMAAKMPTVLGGGASNGNMLLSKIAAPGLTPGQSAAALAPKASAGSSRASSRMST